MTLIEFIEANIPFDDNPLIVSVCLFIIFLVVYDFYHYLISAVLSWFKNKKK